MKTIIPVIVLLISGCGAAEDREPPAQAAEPFDELTETIDRAEQVEQQLQQKKERMDRALENAEKSPDP